MSGYEKKVKTKRIILTCSKELTVQYTGISTMLGNNVSLSIYSADPKENNVKYFNTALLQNSYMKYYFIHDYMKTMYRHLDGTSSPYSVILNLNSKSILHDLGSPNNSLGVIT